MSVTTLSIVSPAGRCSSGAGQHQNGAAEDQPLHCLGPALCVGLGQGFKVQMAARELVGGPRPSLTHTPTELCHSAALFSELLPYMGSAGVCDVTCLCSHW